MDGSRNERLHDCFSGCFTMRFIVPVKDWNLYDEIPAWNESTTGPIEDRLIKRSLILPSPTGSTPNSTRRRSTFVSTSFRLHQKTGEHRVPPGPEVGHSIRRNHSLL